MRKLKLQIQTSIDGYIAAANGSTAWMIWNWGNEWPWDDALRKYHTDLTATADCVLLSRKMATEGFIGHWEEMAKNSDNPQATFAKNITAAHKVVFTKTLPASVWKNTELAKGDLATEVNKLKGQPGKDIIVYGGGAFVSALIKARFIDEFHLVVNPTVLGDGLSIFKEVGNNLNLNLVSATSHNDGIVALHYVSH
ncbi:dihydrofolate reductase [Chitinophaga niastensis]|uniref:Dihydrofolate reductase n=1 Tax=Chitinophaga niastensis TaxID=536980 RepID=A0A2P8HEU3_CHINA|nr:dihydrofolate reductase family protein [Chitinophaga niastensis]PSL44736.1 dihydrofolate reductase [Chitinophaga niastensis]